MKEIFIFDMDGCVLPSMFPNIHENGQSREELIKKVLENGNRTALFPEFIDFYKTHCKAAESIYFMTGRQKSDLGEFTETQLSPLKEIKPFQIIFYPESKSHVEKEYFDWKVARMGEIFNKYINAEIDNEISKSNYSFKIFDDMSDYFPRVKEMAGNQALNITLRAIKIPDDWKDEPK